ncbi:NAD(P)-dependent oxidoreductase [Alkalibacter saccharofermentans]|uniref:Glutamate synthase (NADPH/NADH) small chain n=1 Tax=Alkalibacter saccharofermentans DSM 14828 TaxID=1120975 RepID=A0A1M4YV53_9FIRM|nr:NAD(P)-dependent oxidoreductase [Alkalibacter saccharofermentans]SHF09661.1 glutamate synthase (NADPH/NADH) small chain [Alkalibacter saccharofermentans DSM 14828]
MPFHVIEEAKRCLQCKKPLCRQGCPVNTPIPQMIQLLLDKQITESGQMLFENNPMTLVCSLICDHERQCEGHCILNKKGMPIHVSSIENFISGNYFDKTKLEHPETNGIKTAIIGSGPAGITIAILLAQKGYEVTVFESKDKIGGVLRYGIPEFRLPKKILDQFYDKMLAMGIKIRPNTSIGNEMDIDSLFRDGYKSVFIGTGVWKANALGIKGETLGNVHYAINYLTNPDVYRLGDTVNVIGAGNAAMDVARTVLRKGARSVTVFARRDRISASKKEFDYASIEGVEFVYHRTPEEITDDGVWFKDTITGEKMFYPSDSTIISVSQGPRNQIVSTTKGIDVNDRGLVVADGCGRTTRKGVFASGDVVQGAKTVVEAVHYSKLVVDAMDEYMKNTAADETGD